jgi:hypothetical protein
MVKFHRPSFVKDNPWLNKWTTKARREREAAKAQESEPVNESPVAPTRPSVSELRQSNDKENFNRLLKSSKSKSSKVVGQTGLKDAVLGGSADRNIDLRARAPIKKLSWDEAISTLAIFQQNLKQWEPDFDPEIFKKGGTLGKPESDLTSKEKTLVRLYATHNMVDNMRMHLTCLNPGDFSPYAYFVNGLPVGLMLLQDNPPTPVFISYVVTHPGAEGAGGALIERAVNVSTARSGNGLVKLMAENANAHAAFSAIGFTDDAFSNFLILHPSASDKWRQKDGRWRLEKYIDEDYLANFGEKQEPEVAANKK